MNTDIAQLVSVALYSPKPEETVAFFHDMLGMETSHREGQSVYMRAYEDWYQYTLKITERKEAGLEEVTWRTSSPEALDTLAARVEETGLRRMTTPTAVHINSNSLMVINKKCYGTSITSRRMMSFGANSATAPRRDLCVVCRCGALTMST